MEQFLQDVLRGLQSSPKYLQSKYFYDQRGDELFQKIMHCEDYYLTRCEYEIFKEQSDKLACFFKDNLEVFDVVELGAGDAIKSSFLLEALIKEKTDFRYMPVDISENIISMLQENLPNKMPGLQVHGLHGEYNNMLAQVARMSERPRLVLFLGSNIGNIPLPDTKTFLDGIRSNMNSGDMLLVGFDLKKNPHIIRQAYNDREGITRDFNLNLLRRINQELHGDFVLDNFQHYPSYDPSTGTCKSFLVSLQQQEVHIAGTTIRFEKDEYIHMETSQKYSVAQTDQMAKESGFEPVHYFFDSKHYFLDAVWQVK